VGFPREEGGILRGPPGPGYPAAAPSEPENPGPKFMSKIL